LTSVKKPRRKRAVLDVNDFSLTDQEAEGLRQTNAHSWAVKRPSEPYFLGPVPIRWLEQAGQLPGKALHVGLFLWHKSRLSKRQSVKISLGRMGFGVSEQAARRGLRALEKAGLIAVQRQPGCALQVNLPDQPTADSATNGRDSPTRIKGHARSPPAPDV
jgi:hypothetical protein